MAVMLLDLDRFKEVNDTLGHSIGDGLLCAVAKRLSQALRETDTLARLGGDEFTVILDDVVHERDVVTVAEKIDRVLQEPFEIEGSSIDVRASIGMSMYPRDGEDPESLVQTADVAMYHAKRRRGGGHALFRSEMNTVSIQRLSLGSRLGKALQEDQFRLHYQPVVDLATGELRGAEALIRWQETPDGPFVPPCEFIPYAEETGLILSIERWVLRRAAEQVMAWRDEGIDSIQMAVNISARHFARGEELIAAVRDVIDAYPGLGRRLVIELTETALIQDADMVRSVITELGEFGVPVAIDDFGTGFSGLNYLVDFPVSVVKLDKSFIQAAPHDPVRRSISEAVVGLSRDLGRLAVAEGIETEAQRTVAVAAGCTLGQGYLFGKAVPPEEFPQYFDGARGAGSLISPVRQVG
jgi:diguanylate cyclase (GGDEF)-like protein